MLTSVLVEVKIHRVCPCACNDHVNLMLHDTASDRYVRVRISATAGRAIVSELNGLASAEGEVVDALMSVIAELNGEIAAVRLSTDGKQTWATLDIISGGSVSELSVDASPAMIAACRRNIPVYIQDLEDALSAPPQDIPPAFHQAFVADPPAD